MDRSHIDFCLVQAHGDHVFTIEDEKYHAFPTLAQMVRFCSCY
jgi:hypothetical protein